MIDKWNAIHQPVESGGCACSLDGNRIDVREGQSPADTLGQKRPAAVDIVAIKYEYAEST